MNTLAPGVNKGLIKFSIAGSSTLYTDDSTGKRLRSLYTDF